MKHALTRIGVWTIGVFVLYVAEIFVAQKRLEFLDSIIGFVTLGIWLVFLWTTKGTWRLLQTGVLMLASGAAMLIPYLLSYLIFDDPLTRIDESALLIAGPVGGLFLVAGLIWRGIAGMSSAIRSRRGSLGE